MVKSRCRHPFLHGFSRTHPQRSTFTSTALQLSSNILKCVLNGQSATCRLSESTHVDIPHFLGFPAQQRRELRCLGWGRKRTGASVGEDAPDSVGQRVEAEGPHAEEALEMISSFSHSVFSSCPGCVAAK